MKTLFYKLARFIENFFFGVNHINPALLEPVECDRWIFETKVKHTTFRGKPYYVGHAYGYKGEELHCRINGILNYESFSTDRDTALTDIKQYVKDHIELNRQFIEARSAQSVEFSRDELVAA